MVSKKLGPILMAIPLVMAGCVMVHELAIYGQRPIRYSHVTHVVEEKWKCEDCHRGALEEEQAGMPNPRVCRKCHETQEEIDKYLYPFAPGNELMWTNVTKLVDDAIFSHKEHDEVECEDCHEDILKSEEISIGLRVEKDECISCHAGERIGGECKTCHQSINNEWKPKSHEQAWERFHGQAYRADIEPPYTNRCSLCHADSKCADCHMDREPRDHGANWRHRGHGIAASMDRDRCATCHLSYSCDVCHRESPPRGHSGAWGSPRNRHCLTCHFPLRSRGCNVCHETDSSHLSAAQMPYDLTHAAATTAGCRTCHMDTGAPRHLEKGDDCRNCHR